MFVRILKVVCMALMGILLTTGCGSEPAPLLPQREWKEGVFDRIRLVVPQGDDRQVAEVWLQAREGEVMVTYLSLTDEMMVSREKSPKGPELIYRNIQREVHYPAHGESIKIGYYHLMKGGQEIDFYDNT